MARAHPVSVAALAVCLAVADGAVARAQTTGTLQGTVVDARDGTPLEKVSVRIQDTPLVTITTSDGRFLLENVPSGHRELYVSAVDFVLTRRSVEIPAGEVLEITIPIAAGTGTYTETVNVSSAAGADARSAGGGQVLRSNELQQLRGVITNDPMRAIHVLPGVATGDDLRSEFSVRGLPVRNMNFTFEGISTPLLVHTVQGVQDGGSIAMVNGDVLEEIALSPGAYVERHGNHTGAELNFLVREGSRDRLRGHVRPSLTDTSVVIEGPLGSTKRGSWLLSARKSYLGAVIHRIDPENTFGFGFHDFQVKLVRDVKARHQVQFAITAGRSRLEQDAERIDIDDVQEGVNDIGVAVVTWRFLASPRFVLTQRIAGTANRFSNDNLEGLELHRGRHSELMYRADWNFQRTPGLTFEGGGEARHTRGSQFAQARDFVRPQFAVREDYSTSTTALSSYVLLQASRGRATIAPGVRLDHFTLTGHTSASPWIQTRWPLTRALTARVAGGIYRQEPDFAELKGLRGAELKAFRSYHIDAGVEAPLGRSTKWQFSVYDREDRDYTWLPNSEFRASNGRLVLPSPSTRYENSLDGQSRGAEIVLQRNSPNGLSGWIAYNVAFTKYRNTLTGEDFSADYDQQHTLNVYGVYRLSDRMSFSTRFRAGSNFPVPGYYESRGNERYFLSSTRNDLRVPVYTRLDIRANRTFTWRTTRLTVFAEALNIYDRDNVRASSPGINPNTLQVFGLFDSMFPIIPSAGFSLEF